MSKQNLQHIKKSPPSLISDASRTSMKVMQPPTNRKNGAQNCTRHEKIIKGIALPFYLGSIILYGYDVGR